MKIKEWDGSGLPQIGTVCEYLFAEGDEWRKCKIVAYYLANVVAIDVIHNSAVLLRVGLFRPIKTPEQIAAEERLHAIDEMADLARRGGSTFKEMMSALYDAGYRKAEVKK
ncbi:MAG: hypothetical protein GXZ10_13300 [Gammaproteobacteria bacterium]|nr:hypothetical protein [Gammaproteobacteria bacterium]